MLFIVEFDLFIEISFNFINQHDSKFDSQITKAKKFEMLYSLKLFC